MPENADGTQPIYANIVSVSLGPFDVTLDFGYQSPDHRNEAPEDEAPEYDRVARISMSHAHAKSMLPILARVISEFEKKQGTIPAPGFDQQAKE